MARGDRKLGVAQEGIDDGGPIFAGWEVYDRVREKIGEVLEIFVDTVNRVEYLSVNINPINPGGDPVIRLIPHEIYRVDEARRRIILDVGKEKVEHGPALKDPEDVSPDFEREVHLYYGSYRATEAYPEERSEGRSEGRSGKHLLLEDLTEEELARLSGQQEISVATKGSGFSDVSRDHDRYLAEGTVAEDTDG